MRPSPQQLLSLAALLIAAVALTTVHIALQAPMLDLKFSTAPRGGVAFEVSDDTSINANRIEAGGTITRIGGLQVAERLLVDEPDQLGSWAEYNGLLEDLSTLIDASSKGHLEVEISGSTTTLITRSRTLSDLPPLFWYQLWVGMIGALISAGVYAFRPTHRGALHFAFTGIGLLLSASAASVYSTRELLMAGESIRLLSNLNWFGTLLFTAALVALLWEYPQRLSRRIPLVPSVYATAFLLWLSFYKQLWPTTNTVYGAILVLFTLTFLLAFLQWRETSGRPVERAALKWFLLSIYLGTSLFTALILIPVSLSIPPPASQGAMFAVFLFMFIGIAFGIIRYRLFDLDRWWLTAWSWFLGGLSILTVDVFLLKGVGLAHNTSLAVALALVGWVYFPVRQWLLARLLRRNKAHSRQIHRLVQALFGADDPDRLAELWRNYLADEWSVLDLQLRTGSLGTPHIENDAQTLLVPHLVENRHIALLYPHGGARLFSRQDLETVKLLHTIAHQALAGLTARLQAGEEKRQIFSDLHDDVGAKLLSLLYRSEDPDSNDLARSALQDLRDVVSQPDSGVLPLHHSLADWRAEAQERLDVAGVHLDWYQTDLPDCELPILRLRHISRILREALSNIIKHAAATRTVIEVDVQDGLLLFSISDNGNCQSPDTWTTGRGTSSIRHRLDRLGGHGQWVINDVGGCTLQIQIPFNG